MLTLAVLLVIAMMMPGLILKTIWFSSGIMTNGVIHMEDSVLLILDGAFWSLQEIRMIPSIMMRME